MKFNLKAYAAAIMMAAALVPQYAGALTAADYFVSAPPEVLLILDENTRLDMIDYFSHGLPNTSANSLKGRSRVILSEPQKIEVELSRDATMQIALVPYKSDTLVAVIETVLTPVADSSVRIYDTDWNAVRNQPTLPGVSDFVSPERQKEAKNAEMPDMAFMRISFNPATNTFNVQNTTAGYYDESDRPDGLAMMRTSLDLRYNGTNFEEVKSNTK